MTDEERALKKVIKVNPETKRRLVDMEKEIPILERQIDRLGQIMDVSALKEKIEWGKKAVSILREDFTE